MNEADGDGDEIQDQDESDESLTDEQVLRRDVSERFPSDVTKVPVIVEWFAVVIVLWHVGEVVEYPSERRDHEQHGRTELDEVAEKEVNNTLSSQVEVFAGRHGHDMWINRCSHQ